ncbi:hypothetical protein Gpo141_00013779 [Globisporangium polare]
MSSPQPRSSSSQRPVTRRRRRSAPKPKLSSVDSFASAHVAMLESATLQVSVASGDSHQFAVTTQRSTSTTVSTQRYSFDELRQLKKKLLAVMQQGHLCHAECPWIYSYLKNYFPRKTSLTLSTEKRTTKRRDAIERCLSNVLQFVQSKHNHSCAVVTKDLAQELACALFGYDLNEYSVQLLTPVDSTVRGAMDSLSSLSSFSSLSDSDDEELQTCQLCKSSLQQQHGNNNNSSDDDDDHQSFLRSPVSVASHVSSSSFGSRSSASYYTTTLGCGHRFHDECIVPVLNDTQRCPTCDHLEIQ